MTAKDKENSAKKEIKKTTKVRTPAKTDKPKYKNMDYGVAMQLPTVVCPFYMGESNKSILCESIFRDLDHFIPGSERLCNHVEFHFRTKEDKLYRRETYCEDVYMCKKCESYQMAMLSYKTQK